MRVSSSSSCFHKLLMFAVDGLDHVQLIALLFAVETLIHQILDRLLLDLVDLHAGVADRGALHRARQKAGGPVLRAAVRERGLDGDVARQIAVFRAKSVEHPGTHARPGEGDRAGEGLQQRGAVVHALADHGADDAEIVGALADVREQVADRQAALAAFLNFQGDFIMPPVLPAAKVSGCLMGSGLPSLASRYGFGSNVSIDEGPPCMNRKITRFARAGNIGDLGASGSTDGFGRRRFRQQRLKAHVAKAAPGRAQHGAARKLRVLRGFAKKRTDIHFPPSNKQT